MSYAMNLSKSKTPARRMYLALALVFGGSRLLWIFTSARWAIWDGSFKLIVHVSSDVGPLESVSCEAFDSQENARMAVEDLSPPRRWFATAAPFTGQPITVGVPLSGTTSMSGRELSRIQFRHLVVIGQLQDGRRIGKLAEIPDDRVSRELQVSLP